jgi:hypothetical protein
VVLSLLIDIRTEGALARCSVESIALLAGHDRTATTESVYCHEIRPRSPKAQR